MPFPDNRPGPAVTDDTSYRSPEFPVEYQNKRLYHQAPVLPVLRKIPRPTRRLSSAVMSPDLKEAPVCFSYLHGHCTTVLASHFLQDKFCKGSASCLSFLSFLSYKTKKSCPIIQ